MKTFLFRRVLLTLPVVFGVTTLVFLIIRLIPGDPVEVMLGEHASRVDVVQLRQDLGLDRPITGQYLGFLSGLVTGSMGRSVTLCPGREVSHILLERYPYTLELAVLSMLIAIVIAIPLGVISALYPRSAFDRMSLTISLLGISLPNFWIGPVLIIVFCYRFSLLPMPSQGGWQSIILPAFTLGFGMASVVIRLTRLNFGEVLTEPFIKAARARGITSGLLYWRHALRNALNPVITVLGLQFGVMLAGAVITETIFGWPGVGSLVIEAIRSRDYPVVQGCILIISLTYVLVNLLTDITYRIVDPRIQFSD